MSEESKQTCQASPVGEELRWRIHALSSYHIHLREEIRGYRTLYLGAMTFAIAIPIGFITTNHPNFVRTTTIWSLSTWVVPFWGMLSWIAWFTGTMFLLGSLRKHVLPALNQSNEVEDFDESNAAHLEEEGYYSLLFLADRLAGHDEKKSIRTLHRAVQDDCTRLRKLTENRKRLAVPVGLYLLAVGIAYLHFLWMPLTQEH